MNRKITNIVLKIKWRVVTRIDFIFISGETLVCDDDKHNKAQMLYWMWSGVWSV